MSPYSSRSSDVCGIASERLEMLKVLFWSFYRTHASPYRIITPYVVGISPPTAKVNIPHGTVGFFKPHDSWHQIYVSARLSGVYPVSLVIPLPGGLPGSPALHSSTVKNVGRVHRIPAVATGYMFVFWTFRSQFPGTVRLPPFGRSERT